MIHPDRSDGYEVSDPAPVFFTRRIVAIGCFRAKLKCRANAVVPPAPILHLFPDPDVTYY